jgi:glycopeptide antibiotics resistance protein
LQYVFNKGVSDAGDVLLNFIGGIIGILLFKVSLKLVLQFNKSKKYQSLPPVITGRKQLLLR